jgi:hypothetical protein
MQAKVVTAAAIIAAALALDFAVFCKKVESSSN